jgi:hypothetical protein
MMKLLTSLAFLLSMAVASANDLNFKCDFTDTTYLNQFSLEAKSLSLIDNKFSDIEFDLSFRMAGPSSKVERVILKRSGVVKFFEAGTIYNHRSAQLISVIKNADIESINLLIDMPPFHSSQIRLADGNNFFGSCTSH